MTQFQCCIRANNNIMSTDNQNQVHDSRQRAHVDSPASPPPPPRPSTTTATSLSTYLLAHCEAPELSHSELLDRIHSTPGPGQHPQPLLPGDNHALDQQQQQQHAAEIRHLQSNLRAARAQRRDLRRDIRELRGGQDVLIFENQTLATRLRRVHEDQGRRDLARAVQMEDLKSEHEGEVVHLVMGFAGQVQDLEETLRVEARIRCWGAALGCAFSGVMGAVMIVGLLCIKSSSRM